MKNNVEELKQRIRKNLPGFTQSQKMIADFIVENPQVFALSSVRDLESRLKTSKATIVRLAQTLGYSGFQELKSEFLRSMRKELDPIHRFKSMLDENVNSSTVLRRINEQTRKNLELTAQMVDSRLVDSAVQMIQKAHYVYTMGIAMSSYLAEITAYLFSRVSLRSHALHYGALNFSEQIINMSKNDLILAFSFPPYSPETIKAAAYAKEKKLKIIAITDKATNEIIAHSDLFFQVAVESTIMSNSIMAPLAVIYALADQLGHELKAKTLKTIDSIDHVRKEH